MEKWKFDDKNLRKIYKEEGSHLNMSYKEFKKMAEEFANSQIRKAREAMKESKNEKIT